MVKNTNGGKHKGIARKFVKANSAGSLAEKRTVLVEFPDEQSYAQVTKIYGQECDVVTPELKTFRCRIRGKFTGKYKRSNLVEVGGFVLVGKREWESVKTHVDLLHVYLPHDVQYLQSLHPFFLRDSCGGGGGGGGASSSSSGAGAAAHDEHEVRFCSSATMVPPSITATTTATATTTTTTTTTTDAKNPSSVDTSSSLMSDIDFDLI